MKNLTIITAILITGCSSHNSAPVVVSDRPCSGPADINCLVQEKPEPLVQHIVYFRFDAAVLPDNIAEILLPHSRYLIVHPDRKVHVEGLADETGNFDHNLKLGQRRAEAVKNALVVLGVDPSQIIVHSSGVIKPQSEVSLGKNRRVVLTY